MNTHLKPDQFNDLLLGIADREITAHLDNCPQCRAEIEAMGGTLGSFRATPRSNWSERAARQAGVRGKAARGQAQRVSAMDPARVGLGRLRRDIRRHHFGSD